CTLAMAASLPLPLSSLRLLVPPLRLVSAALWQVVQRRDTMDYGLVEEFVTTVLEMIPDLMSYREKVQLIMGLRAQVRDGGRPWSQWDSQLKERLTLMYHHATFYSIVAQLNN
uniref:TERF1-interacting nuclear factor 2 N-terminal domain-containing protein n=1 Tax=Salmo trutta TaxID=8032 RepID=A0A674B0I5_SALTR